MVAGSGSEVLLLKQIGSIIWVPKLTPRALLSSFIVVVIYVLFRGQY
jgi:hypothetical protein